MAADFLSRLRGIVGDAYVLTDPASLANYVEDWRGRYRGSALCVVRPASTDQVAAVMAACAEAGVAIVPQGGNTGLCGGATPRGGEVVLSLNRMTQVRRLDASNNTLTVDAGCTLQAAQQAAQAADRLFPLSLAAEGTATIGGNLSTNAGGVQVLRYGNARDLVLGLEVVLADGRVWDGLRGLRKDNTGYDLKQLFIGAEGTLGIITGAVLKLVPRPRSRAVAWVAVADPAAAVGLLGHLRQQLGERVVAYELIGQQALDLVLRHIPGSRAPLQDAVAWQVLVEVADTLVGDLDGALALALERAAVVGLAGDTVVAGSEAQCEALWRLREAISEAQRIDGVSIKHDIAVPVSHIPEFIARADAALRTAYPGVRIVCFGHAGDGNLHYNPSKPLAGDNAEFIARSGEVNRIIHDLVVALGGSISAEHGLGQLKRDENQRYKTPVEMDLMRAVKHALDPQGRMNPGKVL